MLEETANRLSRKKLGSGSEGVICYCKIPELRKSLNTPLNYLIFRAHYHHPFQQITITCLQNVSPCTESSSAVSSFLGLDFHFAIYWLHYLGFVIQPLWVYYPYLYTSISMTFSIEKWLPSKITYVSFLVQKQVHIKHVIITLGIWYYDLQGPQVQGAVQYLITILIVCS